MAWNFTSSFQDDKAKRVIFFPVLFSDKISNGRSRFKHKVRAKIHQPSASSGCGKGISAILILPAAERHLNNLLLVESAKAREYSLISKFAFIGVPLRFFQTDSFLHLVEVAQAYVVTASLSMHFKAGKFLVSPLFGAAKILQYLRTG